MVAVAVAGGLTATKLNEKLAANGLPDVTITKPPTVSSVDAALSAGGAAGVLAARRPRPWPAARPKRGVQRKPRLRT